MSGAVKATKEAKNTRRLLGKHPALCHWMRTTFDRLAGERTAGQEIYIVATDPQADALLIRADAPSTPLVGWLGVSYWDHLPDVVNDMSELRDKTGTPHMIMSAWAHGFMLGEQPFEKFCHPPTHDEIAEMMIRGMLGLPEFPDLREVTS
jgi:hypothetical protein